MFIFMLLWAIGLYTALVQSVKAVADCEWYEDVNACIPVLDKASDVGDQYTQLTLELIVCLENNAAAFTGCERDHPKYARLCANVTVSDGDPGNNMCLPQSANLSSLSFSQAREMKSYISCIGEASPECELVRAGLYDFLGCKPCGDVANAAALVEGACTSVFGADGTAAACAAAGAAVPDTDARAIANVTGVPLQPQTSPGNDSGVSVPLLGGPPTVRGGAVDTLGAGESAPAPAPAPMPAPADEAATAPEAGGARQDTSAAQASPAAPEDTVQQSRAAPLRASAMAVAAVAAAAASACML